jgi:lysophospholipid acyltransferase (LPLAT)-like uncharacterized protein
MNKRLKDKIYRRILPPTGLFLINLLSRTYRIALMNPENETQPLEKDKSLIYASWHQRFFPGITLFAERKPIAIMISQSRDGEFISLIAKMLGWEPVRGSSSRGGLAALVRLKRLVLQGYRIGHIVDGPQGPLGIVKPGLVMMAQATGVAVVPTITSAERRWQAGSWDRFMIPKPFSRIIIRFDDPVYVPRKLDKDAFENTRKKIEFRLADLYKKTDRLWNDPEFIKGLFS